jgi:hypothetical protein
VLDIVAAMNDPGLFQPWFRGGSWDGWRTVLKGAFALPMSDAERGFFRSVAERNPPEKPVRECWIIVGRRGGKDSVASLITAHAAALFDRQDRLRPGERALCMALACDRDQAKIVLSYARSYFSDIAPLKAMVTRETNNGFELDNGVDVAVATNSFRSVRGRPVLCCVFDEVSFWRDESSATPDEETYRAILPGMATLPGSLLIGISSPYRKAGLLYKKFREHFGRDGDVLVIKAPSIALNPTLDKRIIARALEEDPAAASAEWLAEFRNDIDMFISRDLLDAAVDRGVVARPPLARTGYAGFTDPSGGVGDSFTLGIAHRWKDASVALDLLYEKRAPFNPSETVEEIAGLLKSFGLSQVTGDKYAAQWVVEAFAKFGITYVQSERDRSSIYLDALPLFASGRVHLLDNDRLVSQFASLERRSFSGGRDRVDHCRNGHDDLCNAASGALTLAASEQQPMVITHEILAQAAVVPDYMRNRHRPRQHGRLRL